MQSIMGIVTFCCLLSMMTGHAFQTDQIFYGPLVKTALFPSPLAAQERKETLAILSQYQNKMLYQPLFAVDQAQHNTVTFYEKTLIKKCFPPDRFTGSSATVTCSYPAYNKLLQPQKILNNVLVKKLISWGSVGKAYISEICDNPLLPYYKERWYYAIMVAAGMVSPNTIALKEGLCAEDLFMVLFLLQHGVDPNEPIASGKNALFYAKNRWSAQLLVAFGANIHAPAYDNHSIIHEQIRVISHSRVTRKWYNVYQDNFLQKRKDLMQYFIEKGVPIATKNGKGNTVLHSLATFGYFIPADYELVRMLLRYGVPLQEKNAAGMIADTMLLDRTLDFYNKLYDPLYTVTHMVIQESIRQDQNKKNNWKRFLKAWTLSCHAENHGKPFKGLPCFLPAEVIALIKNYVQQPPAMIPRSYFY